jgi:small conductance mechanosensitive channel
MPVIELRTVAHLAAGTPSPSPSQTPGVVEEAVESSFDFVAWLLGVPLRILLIIIGAFLLRWLAHRAITGFVHRTVSSSLHDRLAEYRGTRVLVAAGGPLLSDRREQRAQTLGSVLRSVASIVIFAVAATTILGEFSIDLGPLLASAGVVGVALGFGAQTLVKDFLSGIFLILEDQVGVGDVSDAGPAVGTVEEVHLRVTRIRDGTGVVWYVRNGEILRVGNKSQGWSTAIVDAQVAYTEDVPQVQEIIKRTIDEMLAEPEWGEKVLEEPGVAGVESLAGDMVTLRVFLKTAPNEHVGVARELRQRIKEAFEREGVHVPVPVRTSWPPAGPTP